jgi:hypothetical protein
MSSYKASFAELLRERTVPDLYKSITFFRVRLAGSYGAQNRLLPDQKFSLLKICERAEVCSTLSRYI